MNESERFGKYNELAEIPGTSQKKIHYCMPNMIENDVLMIFYDLLVSNAVKCAYTSFSVQYFCFGILILLF